MLWKSFPNVTGIPGVVQLRARGPTLVLHSRAVPQEEFAVSVLNYKTVNVYLGGHLKSPKYIYSWLLAHLNSPQGVCALTLGL